MTAGLLEETQSSRVDVSTPWSRLTDGIVIALQRLGFVVGAMHLLAVPGRVSGIMRSTPVPVLTINGQRYIVADRADAGWVADARAAGRGLLQRGRVDEHIALIELPVDQRAPILCEFPRLAPGRVPHFQHIHAIAPTPAAFASLAPHCPVFRVERAERGEKSRSRGVEKNTAVKE
jgi:hypothetical protein